MPKHAKHKMPGGGMMAGKEMMMASPGRVPMPMKPVKKAKKTAKGK